MALRATTARNTETAEAPKPADALAELPPEFQALPEYLRSHEVLRALRAAMHKAELTAPPRQAMAAEERRRIGAELRAHEATKAAELKAWNEEDAELARLTSELDARKLRHYGSQPSSNSEWRDAQCHRLFVERTPLPDALVSGLRREDEALSADYFTIPADSYREHAESTREGELVNDETLAAKRRFAPREVSNLESVQARQRGLRALIEDITKWTEKGFFSTDEELQEMHDKAYSELPQVKPLADVLAADPRGAKFADRFRRFFRAPQGPQQAA